MKGSSPAAVDLPKADSALGKALPKIEVPQPTKGDETDIAQKEKIQYTGLVAQEFQRSA